MFEVDRSVVVKGLLILFTAFVTTLLLFTQLWPRRIGGLLLLLTAVLLTTLFWLIWQWRQNRLSISPLYFIGMGSVWLIFLIGMIGWGPRIALFEWGVQDEGWVISKRATEVVDENGIPTPVYEVTYTFVLPDGRYITSFSGVDETRYQSLEPGDSLTVYYATQFPRLVTVGDVSFFTCPVIVLLGLASLLGSWLIFFHLPQPFHKDNLSDGLQRP